jgi:hypothetical protein
MVWKLSAPWGVVACELVFALPTIQLNPFGHPNGHVSQHRCQHAIWYSLPLLMHSCTEMINRFAASGINAHR